MKRKTLIPAIFFTLFFTLIFLPKTSYALPFGWQYRRPITIDNTQNSNALTDYQVAINLTYDSDMQSDFSDIRFTWYNSTSGTETEIPYWIESKVNSAWAYVWTKVPQIPASSTATVYVYYKNSTVVSSASNGAATFELFDDFDDASFNTTLWTCVQGTCTESGGILTLYSTSSNSVIRSKKQFNLSSTHEAIARANYTGSNYGGPIGFQNSTYGYYIIIAKTGSSGLVLYIRTYLSNPCGDPIGDYSNSWNRYAFKLNPGRQEAYVNFAFKSNCSSNFNNSVLYPFEIDTGGNNKSVSFDYLAVRKASWTEPTTSIGAEESGNQPPQITIYSPQNTTYFKSYIEISGKAIDDQNTTFYFAILLDSENSYLYENSSYQNNTLINLTVSLSLGNHWVKFVANDGQNQTNQTIYFMIKDYEVSQISYQANVYETTNQNFTIVLRYNPDLIQNITSKLIWNGTDYGYNEYQTKNSTHITNTKQIMIPLITTNNTQIQFKFENKIKYNNNYEYSEDTTYYNQNVLFAYWIDSVSYSNYQTYSGTNYVRRLVGTTNIKCKVLGGSEKILSLIVDNVALNQSSFYCINENENVQITLSVEANEGNRNVYFSLNLGEISRNTSQNTFIFLKTIEVETDQNITFGFFAVQPNMTFKFKVYSPYAPYINCSIQSVGNKTYYPQNYSIFYNYSLPAQNPIRIGYSCKDLVNNINESVVEWDIYIVKLIPVDEEIGIYNTSLWFDPSTNKTAIIRFVAVSDIFNQSLLWENISQNVWLVIPTSSWIFRLETLYTNNYLSSNYYLKDYLLQTKSNEMKICVPENKPQNLQTVFSSVPIERSFMIKRAEIGCVKEISQATHSIGTYWGFYFYSLPALYTLSEVINGTEIFITAIRGEAENLIDLQKILYQFNLIPTKLVGINILNVKKGDSSTIITFYSNYDDDYTLRVYKDNEEIYTHSVNTANFSVIMIWSSFGINESDVLIYKVFNSKGQEVASLKSTAGGREIKYSALFTGSILIFVLLISFLKPINIEKIFILGLLALFVIFYFVPYTESNIYITILSFSTIILLLTEGVIIWKMVR